MADTRSTQLAPYEFAKSYAPGGALGADIDCLLDSQVYGGQSGYPCRAVYVGVAGNVAFIPARAGDASAQLAMVGVADLVDGDSFTLNDGTNDAVTFIFNVSGTYAPVGGYDATHIEVDVSGDTTADQVKTTVLTAISGATLDLTGSSGGSGIVSLVHDSIPTLDPATVITDVSVATMVVSGTPASTILYAAPVGTILPLQAIKILASGTTAQKLTVLW